MSTHEPSADRDGCPAPTGADSPSRSAAVSTTAPAPAPVPATAPVVEPVLEPGTRRVPEAQAPREAVPESERTSADVSVEDSAGASADVSADVSVDEPGVVPRSRSRDLLLLVGICLLSLLLVNAFVARPFAVPSGSMENSLRPGDRLIANQLAYSFGGHPRRGDVVVFDGRGSFLRGSAEPTGFGNALRSLVRDLGLAPADDSVYVKRVIGVGGDRVTSTGPGARITVNGVPVDESSYLAPGDEPSKVAFDVVVPAGKLWVMGDHRDASRDSRDHLGEPGGGFVPEGKVIGRAEWVVYPVGHWTGLDRSAAFAAVGGTGGHGDQR